jgi:hypothetical protein
MKHELSSFSLYNISIILAAYTGKLTYVLRASVLMLMKQDQANDRTRDTAKSKPLGSHVLRSAGNRPAFG